MPLFSVVIPTLNRQRLLDEAVDSVLRQSLQDLEMIVVDDGGSAPAQVRPDPRARVIRHGRNLGISAARNTGIEASSGRYVAFLDDDDTWLENRLEMAVEAHRRAPVALCWAAYMGASTSSRGPVLEGVVPGELLSLVTPSMGATSVERSIVQRFDPSYAASEDVEWWIRMSVHRVATTPSVGCLIRLHDGPREGHGTQPRIAGSLRLLSDHAEFFAQHPRAAGFRWKRIGLQHMSAGQRRSAAAAFARSLRLSPEVRTCWHLARSLVPQGRLRRT